MFHRCLGLGNTYSTAGQREQKGGGVGARGGSGREINFLGNHDGAAMISIY